MVHREEVIAGDGLDARAIGHGRTKALGVGCGSDGVVVALHDEDGDRRGDGDVDVFDAQHQEAVGPIGVRRHEGTGDGATEAVSSEPGVFDADVVDDRERVGDTVVEGDIGCAAAVADSQHMEARFLSEIVADDAEDVGCETVLLDQNELDRAVSFIHEGNCAAFGLEDLGFGHRMRLLARRSRVGFQRSLPTCPDNGRVVRRGLPLILDALALAEQDPEVQALIRALGGEPVEVRERLIGAPAYRSRRMLFASGGEIILHDDAVVATLLHLTPEPPAQQGVDLAEWIPSANNDATLDDLKSAIGTAREWAGFGTPVFPVDGGFVRADFRDRRGWNEPGNLLSIAVVVERPGLSCAPDDDDCAVCADLLIRAADDDEVDVAATTLALQAALDAGDLTEDLHWVRLADLEPLHASGLMQRVESQLTCTSCRRIICFALYRDSPATFQHHVLNDARQHPLEAIPPVDLWGDQARVAAERDAMRYLDHRPGAWFLVGQNGELYLQARYVVNSMVDASALIRLDEAERAAYRIDGHDYISELARRINDDGPHREQSPFRERDLYRGPDAGGYKDAVAAAIVNHTWMAEQRRRG